MFALPYVSGLSAGLAATSLATRSLSVALPVALMAALLHQRRGVRRLQTQCRAELRLRREALNYLLFQGTPRSLGEAEFGRQLSRLIALRSSFPHAALLLRVVAGGSLVVVGSAGMDDLTVAALNRWGERMALPEKHGSGSRRASSRVSFRVPLERRGHGERSPLSSMSCAEVTMVPMASVHGLVGAIAVCGRSRRDLSHETFPAAKRRPAVLRRRDRLEPLETLAARLAWQLAAGENLLSFAPPSATRRDKAPSPPFSRPREHSPTLTAVGHLGPASAADTGPQEKARATEAPLRRTLDLAPRPLAVSRSTVSTFENFRRLVNPAAPPLVRLADTHAAESLPLASHLTPGKHSG